MKGSARMVSTMTRATTRLTDLIERSTALDAVARPLTAAVSKLLPRGPVNDTLSGTTAGHPAHPVLVLAPLGTWLSTTALDLFGGRGSRDAALRLLGIGNLAALPAALSGVNDWMDTTGPEQRVGVVHGLANVGGLTLFTASWLARRRGEHRRGVLLSLSGLAVAGGAGWLGGHLAFARGVGVDTTAFQPWVGEWTDVGVEDKLEGGVPTLVHAHDVPIMLVRDRGVILALADRCTHRGAPLHEGTVEDGCVICPWHGSRFRLADGAVEQGPATRPQPRFEVRVSEGRIEVRQCGTAGSLRTNPIS